MTKNASYLSLSDVLVGLYDGSEDDPLLNGTVAVCSIMYGVRHFSYNGIKSVEGSLVAVHRYTILINYSKVYEASLEEMRRYDIDVREEPNGFRMQAKVIRPTKQKAKQSPSV
jgi:hypothetical protein